MFLHRLPLTTGLLILLLLSCDGSGESGDSSTEIPDTVSENFRQVTISQEGRVEILAARVETYGTSDRTVFHQVGMRELDSDGELTLEGGADMIEVRGDGNGVAEGNIRISDLEGDSALEAESLEWNDGDRLLSGNGPVTINSGDGLSLQGEGFVADTARERYTFSDGVEGTLELDDEN